MYKMFPINGLFYLFGVNWFSILTAVPSLLPHMWQRVLFHFSVHSSVRIWPFAHSSERRFPPEHTQISWPIQVLDPL